jgi:hypothetical protein
LRGHLNSRYGRVFRNVANFVDLDGGFAGERGFQLFRERGRLCVSARKRAHKPRKLRLRQIRREMDAGNAGAGQKLRKAFLACRRAKGNTVQQNLITGSAEQETATNALIKRTSELFPGSLKLRRRPHVAKFIKPREFQQNVQAADKCPRAPTRFGTHAIRRGSLPSPTSTTLETWPVIDKRRSVRCNLLNNRALPESTWTLPV